MRRPRRRRTDGTGDAARPLPSDGAFDRDSIMLPQGSKTEQQCAAAARRPARRRRQGQHFEMGRALLGGTIVVAAAASRSVFQSKPLCVADALKLASAVPSVVADLSVRPPNIPGAPAAGPGGSSGCGGDGSGGGGGSNSGIGDMTRSVSSTSRFFRSIDRDGDGILEKPEMESFVRDTIGGPAFDTSAEVEAGVDQVLERLDRDNDRGLDQGDVLAYWMQLESLLTAEEVSEWVVYAAQLPESVGKIFLEHVVTGYDFPELVDHDGEAIKKELGIEKNSYRKKILRHINARMLGIGTVPTPPQSFKHTLESCSAVTLSWTKSTAKGFPVHSYRVQRRAVPLHAASLTSSVVDSTADADFGSSNDVGGVTSSSKVLVCDAAIGASQAYFPACGTSADVSFTDEYALICAGRDSDSAVPEIRETKVATKPSTINTSVPSQHKTSSWLTVYRGGDNEFMDTGLETGYTYLYRVQAWNSVGRSEWVTLDIARSLKRKSCNAVIDKAGDSNPFDDALYRARRYHSGNTDGWDILQTLCRIFDFISNFVRAIFALAAVGAAIMRFKRANALSSTSANMEPVFPWLWRGINFVSFKIFGIEIVPKSMLGDKNSKRVSESLYDREVKSVGLVGYKSPSYRNGEQHPSAGASSTGMPYNRRVVFGQRKSASTGTLMVTIDKIKENDMLQNGQRSSLQNERKERTSNEVAHSRMTSTSSTTSSKKKSSFKTTFFRRSKSAETEDTDNFSVEDTRVTTRSLPVSISTSKRSLMENVSMSTIDEDNGGTVRLSDASNQDLVDDYNRCNSCHKQYKFPHRFRHHCARCLSTFCHKHGKTTHSNLIACKVPSDCICNVCLEIDATSSRSRGPACRSSTSSRSGSSRS